MRGDIQLRLAVTYLKHKEYKTNDLEFLENSPDKVQHWAVGNLSTMILFFPQQNLTRGEEQQAAIISRPKKKKMGKRKNRLPHTTTVIAESFYRLDSRRKTKILCNEASILLSQKIKPEMSRMTIFSKILPIKVKFRRKIRIEWLVFITV